MNTESASSVAAADPAPADAAPALRTAVVRVPAPEPSLLTEVVRVPAPEPSLLTDVVRVPDAHAPVVRMPDAHAPAGTPDTSLTEVIVAPASGEPPVTGVPDVVVVPAAAPPAGLRRRFGRRPAAAPGPRRSGPGAAAAGESVLSAPAPLATLDAHGITAWFGDHQVLDRVSLTMPAGQVTALIGPSGCGKSTFLRILNRMHELVPSASLAGEVLLDGVDIYDPARRLTDARRDIGMVFQKPNPFPAMSIYDNVIAGLKLTGIRAGRDEKDHLVETSLQSAGLWKEVKDRLRAPGGGLSGGQQQRLCIARSLAIKPKVLLMDEPCSALDPTSTRVIEETMGQLQHEVTIVIVTHNMQQAQRVSQQCAFFLASQGQPGHIVEHGDTAAMFDSPVDPRTFDYVNGRFG